MNFIKQYAILIVVGLSVACCAILVGAGYKIGYSLAFSKQQAVIDEILFQQETTAKTDAQNQLFLQQSLNDALDAVHKKHTEIEELEREKSKADALISDLRSGNRRLSIAIKSGRSCGRAEGEDTASSGSGGAGNERAELDPEAAAALVGIARDGDRNTRERNACVDAYNAVRAKINDS